MLSYTAREYMAITKRLLREPEPWIKDCRLIVEREKLIALMDQHPYMTSRNKIFLWRDLRWIVSEDGHSRKRIRAGDQILSVIQIDLSVYEHMTAMGAELLDKLYREYVAIGVWLLQRPEPWIKDGRLIADRQQLTALMDQHPYLTSRAKTKSWNKLHWIVSQGDRSRKQIRRDGVRVSAVQLDMIVLRKLIELKREANAEKAKNKG